MEEVLKKKKKEIFAYCTRFLDFLLVVFSEVKNITEKTNATNHPTEAKKFATITVYTRSTRVLIVIAHSNIFIFSDILIFPIFDVNINKCLCK